MDLEKVYGLTLKSNSALATDPINCIIAYPAGCTIVLLNQVTSQQTHIRNEFLKCITCLAFSHCGRYLVSGECGFMPSIRIWDLETDTVLQVAEHQAHKYSVEYVIFSPNNKYVVSIGCKYDMVVNVWDWRNSLKIASSKVSTIIKSIDFSENGKYFITVGNRHVKFWYLKSDNDSKFIKVSPLIGRSAILGEQRNNDFCGIACGKKQNNDKVYSITKSGLLCEFNEKRLLIRWVDLKVTYANCITVTETLIFVGCSESVIRCFETNSLRYVTTLPRSHYLGVDISQGVHIRKHPKNAIYPNTIAISCNESRNLLTNVYDDYSIYVWNINSVQNARKMHSFFYHSSCVWGIEMIPVTVHSDDLPSGTFITYASDDTIRLWNPDHEKSESFKIIYTDPEFTFLKNIDLKHDNVNCFESIGNIYDNNNGIRCAKFSPNGKYLAAGDRIGNISIHETKNEFNEIHKIEAHDSEVLCLEFLIIEPFQFLASGSRDKFLHVFDIKNNFSLMQTINNHKSSITGIKFINKSIDNIQMISCGVDKNLFIRKLNQSKISDVYEFILVEKIIGKSMFFDMVIDIEKQLIFTVCHDRNIHVYGIEDRIFLKKFQVCLKNEGSCIKITLDRSCTYIGVSCTNKTISIFDYANGQRIVTLYGHSELVTGLCFSNNCQKLISVSGDGCIFIWKIPHEMVSTMRTKLNQINVQECLDSVYSSKNLPVWAEKEFCIDEINDNDEDLDDVQTISSVLTRKYSQNSIKGKWAERIKKFNNFNDFLIEHKYSSSDNDSAIESIVENKNRIRTNWNTINIKTPPSDELTDINGNKYVDVKYENIMKKVNAAKAKLQCIFIQSDINNMN